MSNPLNVLPFNARTETTGAKGLALPELVRTAKHRAEKQLEPLLAGLFNKIDDALFELADKADNNTLQSQYFDAMREIRLRKEVMLSKLAARHHKEFMDTLQSGKAPSVEPVTLELALINDDELEESIAIRNMIDKATELYADPLYCLSQRLDVLMPALGVSESDNPFGPAVLCEAFRTAVNTLELELKVKLIVFKLFDKFVIQHLGPVYDAANTVLARGGALPQLKGRPQPSTIVQVPGRHGAAAGRGMADHGTDRRQSDGGYPTALPPELLAQQMETFELLQQLLAAQRGGTAAGYGTAPQAAAAAPVAAASFSADEMLATLSSLQQHVVAMDAPADAAPLNLRTQLLLHIGDQSGSADREISQTHADVIDVVGMMFDFILDDPELPDAIKGLIARLQIPMLKVALLDREFFGKKSHPARLLLNELAHAGIGLDESVVLVETPIFGKIEHVVGRILQEFEDELSIFGELLQELYEFQELERQQLEQMQESLERSRVTAAEAIEPLLESRIMPEALRALLAGAWKEHLASIYLDVGGMCEAWEHAAKLASRLVWSIQAKGSAEERTALVREIPSLLTDLKKFTVVTELPAEEGERFFLDLEALHLDCLRQKDSAGAGTAPKARPSPVVPLSIAAQERPAGNGRIFTADELDAMLHDLPLPGAAAEGPHGAQPAAAADSVFDEEIVLADEEETSGEDARWGMEFMGHAAMVRELEVGAWLGFMQEDGSVRRGKLAWKSDLMGEYVFVDRFFKVVRDTNLRQLVTDLAVGQALLVEEVPLMDRALDSVMGALKRYREKVAGQADVTGPAS
jgi:hypothetical protein